MVSYVPTHSQVLNGHMAQRLAGGAAVAGGGGLGVEGRSSSVTLLPLALSHIEQNAQMGLLLH